jgi:hypothetical protein
MLAVPTQAWVEVLEKIELVTAISAHARVRVY